MKYDIFVKFKFSQDAVKTPDNVNKTTEVKGGSNTSVSLTFSSTSGHVDFAKSHKAPDKMLPDSKKITSFAPAKTSKFKTIIIYESADILLRKLRFPHFTLKIVFKFFFAKFYVVAE